MIVRGQIDTMQSSFRGLLAGLVLSIVLVYFLIVINFQSWLDPFIIITRASGRHGRNRDLSLYLAHHAERPRVDGRHHERRRGYGQ